MRGFTLAPDKYLPPTSSLGFLSLADLGPFNLHSSLFHTLTFLIHAHVTLRYLTYNACEGDWRGLGTKRYWFCERLSRGRNPLRVESM